MDAILNLKGDEEHLTAIKRQLDSCRIMSVLDLPRGAIYISVPVISRADALRILGLTDIEAGEDMKG